MLFFFFFFFAEGCFFFFFFFLGGLARFVKKEKKRKEEGKKQKKKKEELEPFVESDSYVRGRTPSFKVVCKKLWGKKKKRERKQETTILYYPCIQPNKEKQIYVCIKLVLEKRTRTSWIRAYMTMRVKRCIIFSLFPIHVSLQVWTKKEEKKKEKRKEVGGKKKDHEGTQAVTQMISTFSTDTCPAPSPLSFFFFFLLLLF